MKEKLSVTVDAGLVEFLDALPGQSRSAKLEDVLRRFKHVCDDARLRRALSAARTPKERDEDDAWRRTMEIDQWGS